MDSDLSSLRSSRTGDAKTQDHLSECHIFSIGSNNEWGFEKEVIKLAPNCTTHTFDCTMDPYLKPRRRRIKFYKLCLDGREPFQPQQQNETRYRPTGETHHTLREKHSTSLYRSYLDLWTTTGIPQAPRILKMDIEGFEYDVLLSTLKGTPSHIWPEQISMEVHWASRMVDLSWMLRTRTAGEMSLFFAALFNVGGYMPVFREFFPIGCPSCMEVLLVRILCEKGMV